MKTETTNSNVNVIAEKNKPELNLKISNNFDEDVYKYVPAFFVTDKNIRCEISCLPEGYGFTEDEILQSKKDAYENAKLISNAVNNHYKLLEQQQKDEATIDKLIEALKNNMAANSCEIEIQMDAYDNAIKLLQQIESEKQ
jgi:hypothetical protein